MVHPFEDFRHFLLAVMLGVLERSKQRTTPSGQYQFAVARGDVRRIGNERAIRLNGLPANYREAIVERVNQTLDELDAAQCTALMALAGYYASAVYTAQLIALDTGARLRVTPQAHGCDGFFAAILEKR